MANNEYEDLISALERVDSYVDYHNRFFCVQKTVRGVDGSVQDFYYEFSQKRAEETESFYNGWFDKKAKTQARLKKNKYMSKGGRIADIKTLKTGDVKYAQIKDYFALKPSFDKLDAMFPNEMRVFYDGLVGVEKEKAKIIQHLQTLAQAGAEPQK